MKLLSARKEDSRHLAVLYAIGLFSLSTTSLQAKVAKEPLAGWYLGTGYSHTMTRHKISFNNQSDTTNKNGRNISFVAGYGWVSSIRDVPFYYGIDITAVLGTHKVGKKMDMLIGGRHQRRWVHSNAGIPIEISAKLGFPILENKLLVFGKFGLSLQETEQKIPSLRRRHMERGGRRVDRPFKSDSGAESGSFIPMVGAGLMYSLSDHWKLQGEYVYHRNAAHSVRAVEGTCKQEIGMQRLQISVIYKF